MTLKIIQEKINNLSLTTLLKIVPFAFTLHELEEWNALQWHLKHQSNIPPIADIDIRTIFLFLIVVCFIVFNLALQFRNKNFTSYILIPFVGLMCYNGFVHLFWTFYFNDYSPGLIFGFFLGVPLMILIVYKMLREKLVKKWYVLIFALLFISMFINTIHLGDKVEPALVNAMLFGQQLVEWLWF